MADLLLDALRPLPVTALGPLLAAMREPAGDAVSARAAVLVAAGMPTSATLRDVENVESKLRAAFPSWFVSLPSRTAVATADTALADALHPLPVAKLVPVLDALRAHPDNTATARSFLLQTGVLEDSITFAALGNVNFKLRNAFPVTVLAQLCFNIVFYYSMLLWNDCSYLATKLLKSELQMHRETCASCWLWALTATAIVNMSTLVLHT